MSTNHKLPNVGQSVTIYRTWSPVQGKLSTTVHTGTVTGYGVNSFYGPYVVLVSGPWFSHLPLKGFTGFRVQG